MLLHVTTWLHVATCYYLAACYFCAASTHLPVRNPPAPKTAPVCACKMLPNLSLYRAQLHFFTTLTSSSPKCLKDFAQLWLDHNESEEDMSPIQVEKVKEEDLIRVGRVEVPGRNGCNPCKNRKTT